jgi:hypothetical protein
MFNPALLGDLASTALEVVDGVIGLVRPGHDPGGVREEVVHLLKGQLLGLGQHEVEENGVGEVAHDEDQVVSPVDVVDGDGGHLANHGVEGKRCHGGDGDALGTRVSVEDLSRDDPVSGARGMC